MCCTDKNISYEQITSAVPLYGTIFRFRPLLLPQCLPQFPAVLLGMLVSTIPVSIIGTRFAMSVEPFWKPIQYSEWKVIGYRLLIIGCSVPIVGMLCGATISGIVVAINYTLKEMQCVIFVIWSVCNLTTIRLRTEKIATKSRSILHLVQLVSKPPNLLLLRLFGWHWPLQSTVWGIWPFFNTVVNFDHDIRLASSALLPYPGWWRVPYLVVLRCSKLQNCRW